MFSPLKRLHEVIAVIEKQSQVRVYLEFNPKHLYCSTVLQVFMFDIAGALN